MLYTWHIRKLIQKLTHQERAHQQGGIHFLEKRASVRLVVLGVLMMMNTELLSGNDCMLAGIFWANNTHFVQAKAVHRERRQYYWTRIHPFGVMPESFY